MVIEDCSDLRRMEAALARYVSPRVLEAVLKSGLDPYQARKYELSVLFADLRGFTGIASTSSAEEVKKLIDEYLTVQIDIVFREGATLDKIVGDEVMVLFGAPLPAEHHAVWAINTALKMLEGHRRLMELWRRRRLTPCPLGIGINSGEMVVGHIGSRQQMNYTVLGHPVNLGARLCSAADGGEILISHHTFELARDRLAKDPHEIWRPVKFVRGRLLHAKGIPEPVQTISVLEA
jgi:adenylate cyclase